ncbi:lipid A deacylase LpxR family protein [Halomonas shantousis]
MKTGRLSQRLTLFTLLAALAAPASAEGLLSLKAENDVFASSDDGHYTNGIELIWSFEPSGDHWTRRMASLLPGWSASGLDSVAYRFGQQIYTPNDISTPRLIEDDRPYAGLLLGGVSLFDDVQHAGWRQASSVHLDVGVVGPASGGEKVQRNFHHLIGSEKPRGWDNQLENEPILNLAYKRHWWRQDRLAGLELEYGPSLGFSLGNLYTYASSGLGLRFGQGLDRSFGIPAVAPAHGGRTYFQAGQGFGWYAFANLEGRYMAHNLLLDGNTFEDSHSVDRREWVGDAQVGVALTWDQWQLAYTTVWRTHEFETQREHDQFGSLTLSTWL